MTNIDKATEYHSKGFNCSQAVFCTYCEQLGLDIKTALKISGGLGGGMGGLGEVCGAVTGAYLLIGLKHGQTQPEDKAAKEKTYAMVREFSQRFIERNRTINCKELLAIEAANNQDGTQTRAICSKAIRDAAEIVGEMLELREK